MNLLDQLVKQDKFSDVEKAIADYILLHVEEVSSVSISQLAEATYSSNAAIIRLCRKTGLDGFRQFRVKLAQDYEKSLQNRTDIDINYPFMSHESPKSIMNSVSIISQEAVKDSYALLPPDLLESAAKKIYKARHVYFYAVGDTYLSALAFANMLIKIGIHSVMVNQFNEGMTISYGVTNQDVGIVVSYSGNLIPYIQDQLDVLRKNRCPLILISTMTECPAVDEVIPLPSREQHTGKTAGYYSQESIRYVLNCLYGIVFSLDIRSNRERKDTADHLAFTSGK